MTYSLERTLPIGRANAITADELRRLTKSRSTRAVTIEIERLRKNGVAICASCDASRPGFYRPENAEELASYLRSLDRRIRNVMSTRRHLGDVLNAMTGQLTL